ncbi:unnamed protein product [Blumeria hordei]|uniref:Protoporphyrinogen oxidase n=1 Tax=Blumeria hordei TaxID=2867405 RepID=A0A383UUY3_BLUHO|nr:unnamed protein product [Blumeria hordei]
MYRSVGFFANSGPFTCRQKSICKQYQLSKLATSYKEINPTLSLYHRISRPSQLRRYSSFSSTLQRDSDATCNSTQPQSNIAVIGGGISGLTTAYYLSQSSQNVEVTLYESSNRLGGWLHSETSTDNGKIVFESGPRTLRFGTPTSLATAEIIQNLKLEEEIIINAHDSVAARNRFVYYPDHLVRMPGPGENILNQVYSLLTEPIFSGAFSACLEFCRPPRPASLKDESVARFLHRRLGSENLVNNIHSAILHGIYAGDIEQLSIRSLFPTLWYMEEQFGSMTKGALTCSKKNIRIMSPSDFNIRREILPRINPVLWERLSSASVYSFRKGLDTLSRALEDNLRAASNVKIRLGEAAKRITTCDNGINLETSRNQCPETFTQIISTLLPHQTSSLTPNLPSLSLIPTVTVMVVNLYYRSSTLLSSHGFGYLIPRSVPFEQNPERALGIVFDSDAIQGQDEVPGTKLTVMIGGHWWDGLHNYPDEIEGITMAKAVLRRHLGISDEPEVVRVNLQKECIPQYTVGHTERLANVINEMAAFNGRLSVTGCGYSGVGVNDCIAAARNLAKNICSSKDEITGLEWVHERLQQVTVN